LELVEKGHGPERQTGKTGGRTEEGERTREGQAGHLSSPTKMFVPGRKKNAKCKKGGIK